MSWVHKIVPLLEIGKLIKYFCSKRQTQANGIKDTHGKYKDVIIINSEPSILNNWFGSCAIIKMQGGGGTKSYCAMP